MSNKTLILYLFKDLTSGVRFKQTFVDILINEKIPHKVYNFKNKVTTENTDNDFVLFEDIEKLRGCRYDKIICNENIKVIDELPVPFSISEYEAFRVGRLLQDTIRTLTRE